MTRSPLQNKDPCLTSSPLLHKDAFLSYSPPLHKVACPTRSILAPQRFTKICAVPAQQFLRRTAVPAQQFPVLLPRRSVSFFVSLASFFVWQRRSVLSKYCQPKQTPSRHRFVPVLSVHKRLACQSLFSPTELAMQISQPVPRQYRPVSQCRKNHTGILSELDRLVPVLPFNPQICS